MLHRGALLFCVEPMIQMRLSKISGGTVRDSVVENPINITRPSGLIPLIASAVALYELLVASITSAPPPSGLKSPC